MINACRKWLKIFLVLGVKKLSSPIAPIFGTRIKFLDFSFLDKFTTVPLILLPLPPITSLSLALNAFEAYTSDDLVVFNKEVSSAAILLKL